VNRREFVGSVAFGLLAGPLGVEAQQVGQIYKIGLITVGAPEAPWRPAAPGFFWERLRELGWIEGQTVMVERRGAGGDYKRIPSLAAELAQLKVNVIVASTGSEARGAQEGTRSVGNTSTLRRRGRPVLGPVRMT
jgi:hypothetical protein